MKICVIAERFYPDSVENISILFSQLFRRLADNHKDLEIHIITSSSTTRRYPLQLESYHDWDGIKIYRIAAGQTNFSSKLIRVMCVNFFPVLAFIKIFYLNKKERYDLVLSATNPFTLPLAGYLMSRYFEVPFLYIVHDLLPELVAQIGNKQLNSLLFSIAHKCQKLWLNESVKIIVPGRCMKRKLTELYNVPSNKIEVITNWSDISKVLPCSKNTSFRKKNNLDSFLVLYAGNIGHAQRLDTVIRAAEILFTTHPHIKFIFIGEGGAKENLIRMAKNLDLKNILFFPEVQFSNYPELLASADVGLVSLDANLNGLAVPSKTYNILASGRPMIAISHKMSEISEMITEFNCGINVEPENASQLAKTIIELHQSERLLLEEMGSLSREVCVNNFSLQVISDKYYQLLVAINSTP